jgi:predicted AAA+ superfamily ATPase
MLKEVTKQQVLDRIRFENPWWISGEIDDDFNAMPRRPYFNLFLPLVEERSIRRAVVLMGPRRVGKTVMLYHTIQHLISNNVNPKKIIFITIENPIYNQIGLEQLFLYAKEATGLPSESDFYIVFDEIQYLREWEVHLKSLVDSYRKDKFIVSGSAAAALKYASNESGAGRFTDFLLPPLSFSEFLSMKNLEHLMVNKETDVKGGFYSSPHKEELNKLFLDYINFGGYPEVIFSETMQANPGRYIRHDIVDKVLLRDLPSLYGISDTRELNSLFTTIAYNTGAEFSLEALGRQAQVQKNTLKKYLEYLEAAFLIKIIRRIDQGGKRFQRDNFFKIYLTNPSLRSALFSPITATDEMIGQLVETAIFAQWMHAENFKPWYARWNTGEVDMVGLNAIRLKPEWAVEIKWSNRYFDKPNELKSLVKFAKEHGIQQPIVTSIDKEGIVAFDEMEFFFIAAASYAYSISKNILISKELKQ